MARPALRLRLAPKFPSRVIGTTGIDVSTSGGTTTIQQDWSALQEPVGAFDPGLYEILAYDTGGDEFQRVPLSTARVVNYREVIVAGDITVTTSDGTIGVNKTVPEATTVNLLAAASGFPLTIKDVAGNAGTYNITIDASGSETIDGASTFVIGSDYQSITLTPVSGGWVTNAEYSGNTAVVPGTYPFASVTVDQRGRITFIQSSAVPTAPAGVLSNAGLSASVGSSALTISLTDAAGLIPTLDSLVSIPFRSATAATGSFTQRLVGSATTLVISSGSTMGFASATAGRLWIVAFDDAGTVRLAAINCRSGVNVFPLGQFGIASSTAEGGAGAADSAHVFYTGTAVTSKAYTVLGYLEWSAGLTTAGTWGIVPTHVDTFKPGMKLPGDVIQSKFDKNSTYGSNNASFIPIDGTPPQNTEGVAVSTIAFAATSSANIVRAISKLSVGNSVSAGATSASICRSDQNDAVDAAPLYSSGANSYGVIYLDAEVLAGSTSSVNWTNRYGPPNGAQSAILNGSSASLLGSAQNTTLRIVEIVA